MFAPPALQVLAAKQDRIVTRQQALESGLSARQVGWLIRPDGRWQVLLRGVYATFTGPVHRRQRLRAALLYGGPRAQLTGLTACELLRIRYVPPQTGRVHILLPHAVQRTSNDAVAVHRTMLLPKPWSVGGMPVSPLDRAVIEGARDLETLREVRALVCEVVQRGRTSVERLERYLREGPSTGSALPRQAVADVAAGCRSAPECELRDTLVGSAVIDELVFNTAVYVEGQLIGIPDAAVLRLRLAFEVDSDEHHAFGEDRERTMRRHVTFAAAGWLVVPFSPRRIRADAQGVRREADAVYAARCRELGC
jgi:very-short-patch-repair endonuclease